MVWSYEKGKGGRSFEISGRNGSIREKESRKIKENWTDIVKNDMELIGVEESVALDRGKWRKIIEGPTPN